MKLRLLSLTLLLALTACSLEQKVIQVTGNDAMRNLALQAPVGLQNFRQTVASREAAMGFKMNVEVLCDQVKGLMSADGDSEATSGPMLLALGTVNNRICEEWIKKEAILPSAARRYFKGADLSTNVSTLSEAAQREATRDLFKMALDRAPTSAEESILKTALTEAQAAAPATAPAAPGSFSASPASHALIVGCAVVLASPDAITQ